MESGQQSIELVRDACRRDPNLPALIFEDGVSVICRRSLLLARLAGSGYPQAIKIAALVDLVRGYEGVKLANIETYKTEVAQLAQEMGIAPGFGLEFGPLPPVPAPPAELKSA